MGKPATAVFNESKGVYQNIGHEEAGVAPAKAFLDRVVNNTATRDYVLNMVEMHGKPYTAFAGKARVSRTNYMFDDIRLTWSIDGGGRFFYRDDEKYSVTNVCGWLKVLDANAFSPKFLFYVLTSQWNKLVFNYTVKAHPSVIRNIYDIPMVSLSTQERVVDILDRFDALTTSLTDGIPAEIAMRREQYEYYRSRLLDFPRLPDDTASVSDGE